MVSEWGGGSDPNYKDALIGAAILNKINKERNVNCGVTATMKGFSSSQKYSLQGLNTYGPVGIHSVYDLNLLQGAFEYSHSLTEAGSTSIFSSAANSLGL